MNQIMADPDSSNHDAANHGDRGEESGLSEEELNEVLGKADALAAELARQLGTADVAVASGDDKPSHGSAKDREPDDDLEAELDELERLVAVAEEQLADPALTSESDEADSEAPSVDQDPDEPPAPDGVADASDDEVPDFMAEFTTADESTTPVADKSAARPEPKLGVVGTHLLGVVGSPASPPVTQPPANAEPETEVANTTRSGALDRLVAAGAPLMDRCLSLGAGISPLLLAGTERLVSWMELIHRPLPVLKETPRRIIGWVALATIGTSAIVFLLSLF